MASEDINKSDKTPGNAGQTVNPEDPIAKVIRGKDFEENVLSCDLIGHSKPVTCLSISYDSQFLLSGSIDCSVRLWTLRLGVGLAVYKFHVRTIWTIDFCQDGLMFASGGADNIINIWATNNDAPV